MNYYVQRSGRWVASGGVLLFTGYSGNGAGLNNPEQEDVHSVGPIPRGLYRIDGPPYDSPTHGPYVMRLMPEPGTDTFGRSGFLVHGDLKNAASNPFKASEGCVIAPPDQRRQIWEGGDHLVTVVAEDSDVPLVC